MYLSLVSFFASSNLLSKKRLIATFTSAIEANNADVPPLGLADK